MVNWRQAGYAVLIAVFITLVGIFCLLLNSHNDSWLLELIWHLTLPVLGVADLLGLIDESNYGWAYYATAIGTVLWILLLKYLESRRGWTTSADRIGRITE